MGLSGRFTHAMCGAKSFCTRGFRFRAMLLVCCLVMLGGCIGHRAQEIDVPRQRLRTIDEMDMSAVAVPPATTEPATVPSTQASNRPSTRPTTMPITLEQVRQMALQNNLDLRVQLISPTISRTILSEEEARFESLFTTDASYNVNDSPIAGSRIGSGSKDLRVTPGFQIPLTTGGFINLGVPIDRLDVDHASGTNPLYSSDVSASISQPLLRGAGVEVNTNRILIASYDYKISQAETKLEVIRVLAAAERAYWRLYAAREDLAVRRQEYDLAVAQLDRARREVAAGTVAEVEVIRAESGVADTLETIINAENALRDRQRELKRIINESGLAMGNPTQLIPRTLPHPVPYKLDTDRLIQVALDQRMEMLELELRIAQESANVVSARNAMLPLVTLDYTYNINGLGPSLDDSFDMVSDRNYQDHRIGLRLEIPIGNEAARARLRRSLANRMQQLATRDQRRLSIEQDVYNAVDQLDANWQRILAAQKRSVLAARVLEAEVRQFEQQLRTSTEVLDAQTKLADAQSAEIAAVTEYQIAQVDLAFATGMLLGESKVSWAPTPAPKP